MFMRRNTSKKKNVKNEGKGRGKNGEKGRKEKRGKRKGGEIL